MDSGFWFEAGALLPSLGVGLLFWFVLRSLLRADRREREAERQAEREYDDRHDSDEARHAE
ncbi:hypothetical protein [Brachybacterium saurashtrense]|uniref:Lysyl-tRNA synthetase n=1 Tax=Brachybacterium saurashtrense TaxID=556288 RepID=A0A345YLM2_9MICO|nr:hypothetical protein [Brachybacterium saurashtrense]AXK44824.1 hypothetical protein DWV08_03710 [Brachybacterium saurashtrense]RRR20800.1 hypothetical protein DXU92_16745 [Brachybacterium saurashtrense]